MPDTPAPQLSDERLAQIQEYASVCRAKADYYGEYHQMARELALTSAHLLDELLADRNAFRQAVVEQLQGLLEQAESARELCDVVCSGDIRAAADALHIEL